MRFLLPLYEVSPAAGKQPAPWRRPAPVVRVRAVAEITEDSIKLRKTTWMGTEKIVASIVDAHAFKYRLLELFFMSTP
jgi:hypothetical protein